MCGICGFVNKELKIEPEVSGRMLSSIGYRGPDDSGFEETIIGSSQIMMGHVRLSILDLSPLGHQPMNYGELSICYNGEVYNFKEIRRELTVLGHSFQSSSDTEVILHSFKEWGANCVEKFIGMFAISILDKMQQKIWLFRDRAGVKPMYYCLNDNVFAFASELKPLMELPSFRRDIDMESLNAFLTMGFIPGDMSIFKSTFKLNAGHWLEYSINEHKIKIEKYWDIEDYFNKPKLEIAYEEAKEELKDIFKSAFSYRLISDVPVGVFLSGGFDSSILCSILTQELGIVPNTFTIGFSDYVDEAPEAEQIAKILGTNHTTRYCTEKDILEFIPSLPIYYDEPFSDTSALPTMLVSKLSGQDVKVVLSADGGDELFAGYSSADHIIKLYPQLHRIPQFVRNHFNIPYVFGRKLFESAAPKYIKFLEAANGTFKEKALSQKSWVMHFDDNYQSMSNMVNKMCGIYDYKKPYYVINAAQDSPEYVLVSEYKLKMKDMFLTKMDRATMSVSIEGREPMLDHRIAEFVAQLPWEYKYKDGVRKRILKDMVYDYLPKELMDKPKRGFSAPVMKWLKAELKDYVIDNLDIVANLTELGFDKKNIWKLHNRFESEMFNNYTYNMIWRLIQFGAWYKQWMINTNSNK